MAAFYGAFLWMWLLGIVPDPARGFLFKLLR